VLCGLHAASVQTVTIMTAFTSQRTSAELAKSEDVVVVSKPVHYPFWFGGSASCFATLFTHPLDLGRFLRAPYCYRTNTRISQGTLNKCRVLP
jgi:hypothetical protein